MFFINDLQMNAFKGKTAFDNAPAFTIILYDLSEALSMHLFGASVGDMTRDNPYKLIVSFALPVFLSEVFQQLYNTADAFIVGRFLGTNALAAVSSSGTLIFLMQSFFIGATMGAGVVISRHFGAEDHDRVSRAIHTNIAFGLASGIFLTVVGVLLTPTFLVWMNTDPAVLPEAIAYFRCYFGGVFTVMMYNVLRSIMTALGDSRRPLLFLIISSLLNIVLDVLFVAVFGLGVRSAAVATVISQGVSMLLCLAYLLRRDFPYPIEFRKIRFDMPLLREILNNGLPAGIQNSVIGFANVIVQSQINSFGRLAMAAYGAQSKIEGFAFLPITSFNMAVTTFVGQNLGAKKYDRAKQGATFGIAAACGLAELVGVIYWFISPLLIGLFDSDPSVIGLGVMHARTVCLFFFLLAFSHSVAAVCRGSGHGAVPMIIMLSCWCVLRVSYILIVMRLFGNIRLIYWAYPLTWFTSSVIYLIYYVKSDWVHGFESADRRARS